MVGKAKQSSARELRVKPPTTGGFARRGSFRRGHCFLSSSSSSSSTSSLADLANDATSASTTTTPPIATTAATATTTTTRYTIVDTPPIDTQQLALAVHKHLDHLGVYLDRRPVAAHTRQAFDQFQDEVQKNFQPHNQPTTTTHCWNGLLILDSGCGTGKSSLTLGRRFPNHIVVGVDRSIDRLGRVARNLGPSTSSNHHHQGSPRGDDYNKHSCNENDGHFVHDDNDNQQTQPQGNRHVQRVASNVILVRAELVHFWRLWVAHGWAARTDHHYLLYPNPYPKKSRLKQRWYAHASFPLLLQVCRCGGDGGGADKPRLTLRSNWEMYLQEFANAVVHASEYKDGDEKDDNRIAANAISAANARRYAQVYASMARKGPTRRTPGDAWTNFEAKYDNIGEATYELVLCPEDHANTSHARDSCL